MAGYEEKAILIVCHNDLTRNSLIEILRETKIAISIAVDAQDAMRKIESTKYQVIFVDLILPSIDGKQLIGILRRKKIRIPVIAFSSKFSKDILNELLNFDVKNFLTVPFSKKNVLDSLKSILSE